MKKRRNWLIEKSEANKGWQQKGEADMQEQKKYNLADGNIRKRFVTYKQAAELYSMGMSSGRNDGTVKA